MDENRTFFKLLRAALGLESQFDCRPDAEGWAQLYRTAQEQALTGILFNVLNRLASDQRPPADIVLRWTSQAEIIKGANRLMNEHSARLTRMFESEGFHTAILKGQANARLYPDPFSRQSGDIDIYVDGSESNVTKLLMQTGLLKEVPRISNMGKAGKATTSYHHIHLPANEDGVYVEVHFRPSSGNYSPVTNHRLQKYLEKEIRHCEMVPEGFRVPSIKFALAMQLAHIQHHYLQEGIGLRQISDYLELLRHASAEDLTEMSQLLGKLGLRKTCGALMSLMQEVYGADAAPMLCEPDAHRGKRLLSDVMGGGNFGHYSHPGRRTAWKRFSQSKLRKLSLLTLDCREILWSEVMYWKSFLMTAPERLRRGSLSLSESQKKKA